MFLDRSAITDAEDGFRRIFTSVGKNHANSSRRAMEVEGVRTMDVGEVEKQRWNGCPTGDGRFESIFVGTWDGRDRTGQGRDSDESKSQLKDAEI